LYLAGSYEADEIKEDKMDETYSTHGRDEKYILIGKHDEKATLETFGQRG
jgi:hypothetical protein